MSPQCVEWGRMMAWDGAWLGAWPVFWMMHVLWWVVLMIGVVVTARWLVGRSPRRGRFHSAGDAGDQALTLLRERYARGEIDQAEYDERKRVLGA